MACTQNVYPHPALNCADIYQKHYIVTGTVTDTNYCGCYVKDDNCDFVVYYYGNGMKCDRVQLSVQRINTEKHQVTCVLESVLEYGDFVV